MANVADNFLNYFRTSDAAYDTNNQGTGIGTNGLSHVRVDRFVASKRSPQSEVGRQ